jgi:uncharacterized protein YjiS (DUF1127 family)
MKHTTMTGIGLGHGWWPRISKRLENWRARQSLRELEEAEDWLLKDIGITRNDVSWALSLPLSVNGAEELRKRIYRGRSSAGTTRYGSRAGRRGSAGDR